LSIRAFCNREGVAESAFYFWRRELERRDTEPRDVASSKSSAAHGQPRFVPIAMYPFGETSLGADVRFQAVVKYTCLESTSW